MSPLSIILIILSYFIVLLAISYVTGKKADNAAFFIGSRKSPWYIVAIGMIGASLSGVTFISVPGWVVTSKFSYMQMVFGYVLGYLVVANILLPLYYRLNLTSIYTYLEQRFGFWSYKTGAAFFLISRVIGASFRLYLVASVLQLAVFDAWNFPFEGTVIITILLIWLYTFRGGIRTIVWTDTLQTVLMLTSVMLTVYYVSASLELTFKDIFTTVRGSGLSKIFFFEAWREPNHFIKQFLSGAFITIVMTGLDQDMMQKNLSCRNLQDAQKNMYWYGLAFVPVNLLFMSLGVLLVVFAQAHQIPIPDQTDNLFPLIATQGYLPPVVTILFILGLIAAAYSSADSALTALTTSFTLDILPSGKWGEDQLRKTRMWVHVFISFLLVITISIFRLINDRNVISAIFIAAGYTYGPLLGLYAFGMFTRKKIRDPWVPVVAVVSPVITYLLNDYSEDLLGGYKFGFELLIVNGIITFLGLLILTYGKNRKKDEKSNK